MSRVALFSLVFAALALAQDTRPQFPKVPLADQIYPTPDGLPYQLYNASDPFIRGPQSGFNQCNSTTETQDSKCQTAIVNDITDFCLWGGIEPNQVVANIEGEMVAWCTKKGHGTRVMPANTLQSVQVLNAPGYVMITGVIDQSLLDLDPTDPGGEEDFGGQDLAGNPIGALVYSTHFDPNQQLAQIRRWTEFIGSGQFCMKICKGADDRADELCRHTLDRIGLGYNCPSKFTLGGAANGTFEVCDSADMTPPGVYTGADGVTSTYTQGPEGAPLNVPYTPTAAASSNCQTFTSSAIYTDAAGAAPTGASGSGSAAGASATGAAASGSHGGSAGASASRTGSAASASATGASSNGAGHVQISALATVAGTFAAALLFA